MLQLMEIVIAKIGAIRVTNTTITAHKSVIEQTLKGMLRRNN